MVRPVRCPTVRGGCAQRTIRQGQAGRIGAQSRPNMGGEARGKLDGCTNGADIEPQAPTNFGLG